MTPVCKRPLLHTVLTRSLVALFCVCVLLSAQSGVMLKTTLDRMYYMHCKDIVTHMERVIDADDLQECIITRELSDKYKALQIEMNHLVDEFETIYIYVSIPSFTESILYNVIASTNHEERARGLADMPLFYAEDEGYSEADVLPYREAWKHPTEYFQFISKPIGYESSFTVSKALTASDGTVVAICSADISLSMVNSNLRHYITENSALAIVILTLCTALIIFWVYRGIALPLKKMGDVASDLAVGKTPDEHKLYQIKQIKSQSEIGLLADALVKRVEREKQ